ncbi:ferredoxin--NADP reductase [Aureivirga sp. CE67]|uniref:ferredoxin--NADP reductase n=1 Tax=Aureivirga sp. CE67 TaxID=1788983 RepID=UPI0018C9F16C|nr:ferredoxin--NADP reductase [Aureivirga sp. CE67]
MNNKSFPLKVIDVKHETKDAVSISFDLPYELYETFDYKAGQHLTLIFNINDKEVRRSYSLCSSPVLEENIRIGVKRVKNGLVSNYINDKIKIGDTIEIMPPEGRFYADSKKEFYKTYYLFSAGSGITPIFSIAKTVLNTEERSFVYLFFGNRDQESIIFKKELDELKEQFPERFILVHTLSKPKTSWFSKNEFEFRKGRVDEESVNWFINEYPPYAQNTEYYICGPGKMIEDTEEALHKIDVPQNRIFKEYFGSGKEKKGIESVDNAVLIATLNGDTVETTIPKGKTILRTLIDFGENPPYSCEGGVCSTCACKLVKGKVAMKKNLGLSDEDVEKGYILSCQSLPLTDEVEVEY